MTAAGLEILINELFEHGSQDLDLRNLQNSRLISRTVKYRTQQESFRSRFVALRIGIIRSELEAFADATAEHGSLLDVVEEFTLADVVYDIRALVYIPRTGKRCVSGYTPDMDNSD